jgi:hypothetical protein
MTMKGELNGNELDNLRTQLAAAQAEVKKLTNMLREIVYEWDAEEEGDVWYVINEAREMLK